MNYFLAIDNANEMKFGVSVAHFKLAQADIEEAWRVAKTLTDSMDHQLGQAMIATIQFARELIVNGYGRVYVNRHFVERKAKGGTIFIMR